MERTEISSFVTHDAEKHLRQSCSVMARLIAQYGPCLLAERECYPFQTLINSIISQQLSAKAAKTIKYRVQAIVPDFMPASFLAVSPETLRTAGLSAAKARTIIELAKRERDGRLNLKAMPNVPDTDVIAMLTEIPGIGQWTAEMFLIFGLHRPNVLSLGDAGLQRATRLLFGDNATLESVGTVWHPYRSIASWYLWRVLD